MAAMVPAVRAATAEKAVAVEAHLAALPEAATAGAEWYF
jgi:hypothetical protein